MKVNNNTLIRVTAGMMTTLISVLGVWNWGTISDFLDAGRFLFNNVDEFKHLMDDGHEALRQIYALEDELRESEIMIFKNAKRLDSLTNILILTNKGKYPYDSIWVKSRSGHYYSTTIKEFLHND